MDMHGTGAPWLKHVLPWAHPYERPEGPSGKLVVDPSLADSSDFPGLFSRQDTERTRPSGIANQSAPPQVAKLYGCIDAMQKHLSFCICSSYYHAGMQNASPAPVHAL